MGDFRSDAALFPIYFGQTCFSTAYKRRRNRPLVSLDLVLFVYVNGYLQLL